MRADTGMKSGLATALLLAALWLPAPQQAQAQFQSYASRAAPGSRATGRPFKYGSGIVYPEHRHANGMVRWIAEQMPLSIWVSPGLTHPVIGRR